MNTPKLVALFALTLSSLTATAQTVQYVTLYSGHTQCPLQTNQIVSLVGYDWGRSVSLGGFMPDGTQIGLSDLLFPFNTPMVGASIPQMATGLTNVGFSGPLSSFATLQITTPATANVVSNYVPADAVVIPSSATGPVQIILESSSDLINWTAANPGIYGPSSATNRFFRVRAVVN